MSDEKVQTFEEVADLFYQDEEAEPLEVPTAEVVNDEGPVEEEVDSIDDTTADAEEEASADDNDDEDSDTLVYEINGKEYTAEQIEQLESGNMMQADFTKKTTALARDREVVEQNTTLLSDAITKTNDLANQLEVLVGEDKDINWAELKEDDPDRYIELKERADNRKSKLEEVKANNQTSNATKVDVEAERVKLIEANPQWIENDKPTQAYKDDMNGLEEFYKVGEWTQDQVNFINGNASLAQLVLDSVRRNADDKAIADKKASAKKKIIATPKTGKSKAKINQTLKPHEIMYGED